LGKNKDLIINGENGYIKTGNYKKEQTGTLFDLSTGKLESQNFSLNS